MKTIRNNLFRCMAMTAVCIISLFLSPISASASETYKFERMWPTLQQPWYFNHPSGVAVDDEGFVYMVDMESSCIHKFTSDGHFVSRWGKDGSGDGEFYLPSEIAIDNRNRFLYVADMGNDRVQKFTLDGKFLAKWGEEYGGKFKDVAVDSKGFVYVADSKNKRIHKFTSDGISVIEWGKESIVSEEEEFISLTGVAIDSMDSVYVSDKAAHRVYKFASDGTFLAKWGEMGDGDGQLSHPKGIAVDKQDYIYVADSKNHRIQKFDSDGKFLAKWGSTLADSRTLDILDEYIRLLELYDPGSSEQALRYLSTDAGDGELQGPVDVAVDRNGVVYVADADNHRVQKFDQNGKFVAKWTAMGNDEGMFTGPVGIASDTNGFIYVTDSKNHRIQKFNTEGRHIATWGHEGSGLGEFKFPTGIAVDGEGNIYVADAFNYRVQKLTPGGDWSVWGGPGLFKAGDGNFLAPLSLAVHDGHVYVADSINNFIRKFTADGVFQRQWEAKGPVGLAVDDNSVYSSSPEHNLIQKFSLNGNFLGEWGTEGSEDGELFGPTTLAVHGDHIYVNDSGNHRIQKFTFDGGFVEKIGELGVAPGQFVYAGGLCLSEDGKLLYVADIGSHRIQVINKKGLDDDKKMKAIIVAGGGPYPGNSIWDETQMSANFAYRVLTYRGFTNETIFYLSADTDLDLDGNGQPDVDRDATNANLREAIIDWAKGDGEDKTEDVVLYLVDHGGTNTFRMSATDILGADELNGWLNELQNEISGKLTIVYDACESGSFLSALKGSEDDTGNKERIVITSTSPGELAWFVTQGSVSFSNYFWTHIFKGSDLKNAFDSARKSVGYTTDNQHPLLDDNRDGAYTTDDGELALSTYIGTGFALGGDAPVIVSKSLPQEISGTNTARLEACVVNKNEGDEPPHVWAVIRPPDYRTSGDPVYDLPSIDFDLMPGEDGCYELTYNEFDTAGTYQIAIYARDNSGNTSPPELTTVTVDNPLKRKAVILIGGSQSDIWPVMEQIGQLAYNALFFQGYSDDNIYLMSPVTFSSGVDALPTLENLEDVLSRWAANDTRDVVLYMIGNGGDGIFHINPDQTLSADVLGEWLDNLQASIPGKVTFIYDSCRSGSFFPLLEGEDRILIGGSDATQPVHFLSEGGVSFSKYFWSGVFDGESVRNAFISAKQSILFLCDNQTPQLDDNGNGIPNEQGKDGRFARNYFIGDGIMWADDEPVIGNVSPEQNLNGEMSALIWAKDITTTGTVAKVWSVITVPAEEHEPDGCCITEMPTIDLLLNPETGRYEGTYNDFITDGKYLITIYAKDTNENVSMPANTKIYQGRDKDYDNDGVFDEQDAFPQDPKEWADSDGDGVGDNADTDDDNDGMTDEWEERHGLNPLADDATGDLDGDEFSNLQEYNAGSDPANPNDPDCNSNPINLNTWTKQGDPKNGRWVVSSDGNWVIQKNNDDPTFFISPESFINKTFNGTFRVTDDDDDFIGFVFGFQSINDFYLFAWKQWYQDGAVPGFTLAHVTGGASSIPGAKHISAPGYEVLAANTGIGWARKTYYNFTLTYTSNKIRIDMAGGIFGDGTMIFNCLGDFYPGSFGFFNQSQRDVYYQGFTEKCALPVVPLFEAGVFTVGMSGIINIDWLYDGGMYEGEFGIFSLSGMDDVKPGSMAFIEEAVKRAMSNTDKGYIIFSDATEGARLSGTLGGDDPSEDRNLGPYKGLKGVRMNPGDTFATILIPNDMFESLWKGIERGYYDDPASISPNRRPIFSLATSNDGDQMHFGQLAKISDAANALAYEDMILSDSSDRDYNDIIVNITGALVSVPALDHPDLGFTDDWRVIENPVIPHIEVSPPDPDTLWMSITLKSPADLLVHAPDENVCGKEGCYIPGATFEFDENGHQIISLPKLDEGDYRIVLQGKNDGGLCHLEIIGFQGEDILSQLEKPFEIEPHQVLTTLVSASLFSDTLTVDFKEPEVPQGVSGAPLTHDFDGDADIDDDDIGKVSSIWNTCKEDQEYDAFYDFDDDDCITILDIMRVVVNSKPN